MRYDFSGYATKNDIKCSDGRTILHGAFKENDGQKVPLVWQHIHNDPNNVLGHAVLENRDDGVYAFCCLNDTPAGVNAKQLVQHGDIESLSIYANDLVQQGSKVIHGNIREVSLVLSGANPGALIDNLSFQHGDMVETSDDEAIIYSGMSLAHEDTDTVEDSDNEVEDFDPEEIYNSMTPKQQYLVQSLVEAAKDDNEDDEDDDEDDENIEHSDTKGNTIMNNVFMGQGIKEDAPQLTHSQIDEIFSDARNVGSLKDSVLAHAAKYGITNPDLLFPDAKNIRTTPDWVKRRTEWVSGVLSGTHHSPFSRIRSMAADITADEARAKGYIKGTLKKEEFFSLSKRVTTPTTIYKKQKLDRDDIIDITDFDVVSWLKAEMRMMLDEEIARAILIGDGREVGTDDKINEDNIRPVWKDDDFYSMKVDVTRKGTMPVNPDTVLDAVLRARGQYEGTGNPTFFTTPGLMVEFMLMRDKNGRRIYETEDAVKSALRVSNIVEVPLMENQVRTPKGSSDKFKLLGLMVNLSDYTVGADKGGAISFFDDFDIDYNQQKYLIETRISGTLTKPKSALVIEALDKGGSSAGTTVTGH